MAETNGVVLDTYASDGSRVKETTSEAATLVDRKRRVDVKTASKLRFSIIVVSWATVIFIGALGITTFVLALEDDSSAAFAFALDAILDCLSSIVVIWRYSGSGNTLYSSQRENIACGVLACLFLLSALSIATKSTVSIARRLKPARRSVLRYIFLVDGIVCVILLVCKFYIGHKLESRSIITDAFNSLIGAVLAFSILCGAIAYDDNPRAWRIDPIIGIICSVFLIIYGIWLLVTVILKARKLNEEKLKDQGKT